MTGLRGPGIRLATGLLVLGLLLGAAGCMRQDRLAEAQRLIEQGRSTDAVTVLKGHLQQDPDNGPVLLMLGRVLADIGDASGAEVALRRALSAHVAEDQVLPLLARSQLDQGHYKDVAQGWRLINLNNPESDADLKSSVAMALQQLGDTEAARALLVRALTRAPSSLPAQLAQARLELAAGQLKAAGQRLEAITRSRPESAEGWLLFGQLAAAEGRPEQAQAHLELALQRQPAHVQAHATRIGLHLARRDLKAAELALQAMQRVQPNHPQTVWLAGQVAFQKGDLAQAESQFQLLLKAAPDHPAVLQSAGAVALRLGQAEQAERLLGRALQQMPGLDSARRLQAQAQLAQGNAERALATLAPLIEGDAPGDAQALTLAAQAHLAAGNLAGAQARLKRAAELQPDDPRVRAAQALQPLAQGRVADAVHNLQALSASESGPTADLALVSLQLRARDWPAALSTLQALERKSPGRPATPLLRGQLEQARGDARAARAAYEAALARDAAFLPALSALARLDLLEGRPAEAPRRLRELVARQPRNTGAVLALAEVLDRSGAPSREVASLLADAAKADPLQSAVHLARVEHHLAAQQFDLAVEAAQAGLAQRPDDPQLLERLGRAQLGNGAPQQAATTFRRMSQLNEHSVAAQLGLADVAIAEGRLDEAARQIGRALAEEPGSPRLERLAFALAMRRHRLDEARTVAQRVQQQQPRSGTGLVMEAEIERVQSRLPAAVALLERALKLPEPGIAPQQLHQIWLKQGRRDQADALAARWVREHPKDGLFLHYLGDLAQRERDWPRAMGHYRALVDQEPRNGQALNNLAWVMLQQKRPEALAIAERAAAAWPGSPIALDTLSRAQAAAGQSERALASAQEAVARSAEHSLVHVAARLNLARLHADRRQWQEARRAMGRLGERAPDAPRQQEVTEMLRAIEQRRLPAG